MTGVRPMMCRYIARRVRPKCMHGSGLSHGGLGQYLAREQPQRAGLAASVGVL